MPTFEHPPEWWISLANLTQWLHWPAWAAIFSALALWNTARLADRANRNLQHKDAVFLMSAREMLKEISYPIRDSDFFAEYLTSGFPDVDPDTLSPAQRKKAADSFREVNQTIWRDSKAFENIETTRLAEFPSVLSFMTFSTAKIYTGIVRDDVAAFEGSQAQVAEILENGAFIEAACATLEREAGKLSRSAVAEYYEHERYPDRTMSLKSLPPWLRTTWTSLPFARLRHWLSTRSKA